MKRILELLKEPFLYIATFIFILIAVAMMAPKDFGLPEGILDSVILVLTLLGMFIDKYNSKHLKLLKQKIVCFLFNLEATVNFWFRFVVIIIILAIVCWFLYYYSGNIDFKHLFISFILLSIPYIMINIYLSYLYYRINGYKNEETRSVNRLFYLEPWFNNKEEAINPEAIYYVYLLLTYITAMLNKLINTI